MGYGNVRDKKYYPENKIYSNHIYCKCIDCGKNLYIKRSEFPQFQMTHEVLYLIDLNTNNLEEEFKLIQQKYFHYLKDYPCKLAILKLKK